MPQRITIFAPGNTDLWNRFWKDGDVSALISLFEHNSREFSATCYGILNEDRAVEPKDLISEQILKFIEYRKRGKDYSHRKDPKSFIKVCLSNACKSHLRKTKIKRSDVDIPERDPDRGAEFRQIESRELMEYLQGLIRSMEDNETKQCRVFVLYLMDVPVREIAERVKVEEAYVHNSISKIRKKTFFQLMTDLRGRELIDTYPVFFQKYFKNEYR